MSGLPAAGASIDSSASNEGRWPVSTLTVRNLDDDLKARVRVRAAQHGRSMEAEVRVILRDALVGESQQRGLGISTARFAARSGDRRCQGGGQDDHG